MHIYMSRHGESINNTLNIIGGDSNLSKKGIEYSKYLGNYFHTTKQLSVWTSNLKRTQETASFINSKKLSFKNLNEIDSGNFDGLILENIMKYYPNEYLIRNNDKLNQSYPNGENYLDLQKRVTKVLELINIENDGTILIIAHQAVCRVIYSYFTKKPLSECTNIKIDLHTLYKFSENSFTPDNT